MIIILPTYSQNIDSIYIDPLTDSLNNHQIQNNDSTLILFDNHSDTRYKLKDTIIKFSYYQDLKELLYYFPGVFIYEMGSFGYNHSVMIDYMDNRRIEILNNSITSNDPFTGLIDLNIFTVEDLEKIEYINTVKSFLYGFNSNSGVINLIKKKSFHTKTFSKIRYSESAYEETSLDGIFSKNILSNWNISLGFRRNATEGRYINSEYDSWNLRFITNYTFENRINTYFSVVYNQNKIGTNGGIDLEKTNPADAYDRLKAFVLYENAYQKLSQNDLQFGIKGNLLNNQYHFTSLLFYLSNRMFNFNNSHSLIDTTLNYIKNHTRWMGIKLDHNINLSGLLLKPELKLGFEIRSSQVMQSSITKYKRWTQGKITGDLKFSPIDIITINVFSRLLNSKHTNTTDAGLMIEINPYDIISIDLGYSYSHRFPYEIEQIFSETPEQKLSLEKHNISKLTFTVKLHENTNISVSYIKKYINDAIIIYPEFTNTKKSDFKYSVVDKVEQNLLNFNLNAKFWKLESIMNFTYNIKDIYEKSMQIHPRFSLFTELFFKEKLFHDKLLAKAGFRGRFYSEQNSYKIDIRHNTLYPNTNYILGNFAYLDAILFLQIGNAKVNFTLENIFNNECILTYYYPLKDRSLRLGINWIFED